MADTLKQFEVEVKYQHPQLSLNRPRVKKIAHGIWLQIIKIDIKTKHFALKITMNDDSFLIKVIFSYNLLPAFIE